MFPRLFLGDQDSAGDACDCATASFDVCDTASPPRRGGVSPSLCTDNIKAFFTPPILCKGQVVWCNTSNFR